MNYYNCNFKLIKWNEPQKRVKLTFTVYLQDKQQIICVLIQQKSLTEQYGAYYSLTFSRAMVIAISAEYETPGSKALLIYPPYSFPSPI